MKKYLFRVILSAAIKNCRNFSFLQFLSTMWKNLALMGLVVGFFACGDDSGSTSASGENSTLSSAVEDDESSSSINDDSSSSVTPGIDPESSSSSKIKIDNSSSSTRNTSELESSSSEVVAGAHCEKEGDSVYTQWGAVNKMYVVKCVEGRWKAVRYFYLDSSQVVQKTREEKEGLDSVFNPDVEYGEYKDIRDGHVYKTITFVATDKKKYEMFAENLNYGTFVKHDEDADVDVRKYCYDDDEWYCEHLGGLYTWSEAMRLPRACDTVFWGGDGCPSISKLPWQGICPEEWKVADNDMFEDAYKVKGSLVSILSKSGWTYSKDNTNSLGLSVYATGTYTTYSDLPYRGQFENLNLCASFWDPRIQSSELDEYYGVRTAGAATICAFKLYPKAEFEYESNYCTDALSIRCVREIVE